MPLRPTYNPSLPFIIDNWSGNPLNEKNQYVNLDGPSQRNYWQVLKWQAEKKPLHKLKHKQQHGITITQNTRLTQNTDSGLTWLGHASFLITLSGKQIIVDPILEGLPVVVHQIKRYTPLPLPKEALQPIDYILITHNHRDHCDQKSLQLITSLNPKAIILTGLGIAPLLRSWKIGNTIIEAGWFQRYPIEEDFSVTYLPAKHWNRRGLTDLNEMLWGSMMIESKAGNIYFGADSGLGIHFEQIAKIFPKIDYAMIGIGAYKPEWFMHPSHTSPADALQVLKTLNAGQLIPMHFGTFDLSDEPIFYPKQELQRLQEEQNINEVLHLSIGGKHYF
jgi:L-ascorbate metabolism protein UlaG (beta-lactamase superfamily)